MSISACVGEYATTPYRITGLECNVYCIEELCFCIRENAFLLDMTFMNDGLVDWIDKSLGLGDLSKELYPMIHKKGSLSGFVTLILEYAGLYDTAEICRIGQLLKQGTGLSGIEKKKTQIDHLFDKKKYVASLRGYDGLLKMWSDMEKEGKEVPAGSVKAAILHNKGVVLANLMLYEDAAHCFYESFCITEDKEELLIHLSAKRLQLCESDYLNYVASNPEFFELTLQLEKKMEKLNADFLETPQAQKQKSRSELRTGNERTLFEEVNDRLTLQLKNEYRECVCD